MDAIAIARMQNGQPFRECRDPFRWIETEENERLRRPVIECSVRPERPASHVRESFSFPQIKFASLPVLRRIFLLGNIQCVADQSRDPAVLDDWLSGAVHNAFSLFRMLNALRHVYATVLAKDSLERFGYDIAIFRMQNRHPLRACPTRRPCDQTEENERLRRPVIECSIRPERPASHVRESFSLPQIKFASLDARQWALRPLRSSIRAVAIHLRSVKLVELTIISVGFDLASHKLRV